MAQPSYEYALGRISVLSTHLLTAAQLRRIAEADSTKAAMKLLLETGYGENTATEQELAQGEIDLIIRAQMQLTRKRIQELTPDPELTGLFLLPVDTHNLKCLLKARLLGTQADAILREGGNFDLNLLKDMVQTKYYEDLPPIYCQTLNETRRGSGPGSGSFPAQRPAGRSHVPSGKGGAGPEKETASSGSIFPCGRIT